MSRLIVLAKAIIVAAIIGDIAAISAVAYRWVAFSQAPGVETWSGLMALTVFVIYALIQARSFSKK